MEHIHFIGIGGIGMSGIAQILLSKGYAVSGSDLKKSHITERLEQQGADIFYSHKASNIENADTVVISSAISEKNPELMEARAKKLNIMQRAQMLSFLMQNQIGIAISGTHGKTTTTSMIAYVMHACKMDPTTIIGGELGAISSNASSGKGNYLVAEADESDASFLHLSPKYAIITNIDSDVNLNTEPYLSSKHNYNLLMKTVSNVFLNFTNKVDKDGSVILCTDSEYVRKILPSVTRRYLTYGINHDADLRAVDIKLKNFSSTSRIYCKHEFLGELKLKVPGRHNIQNALACIAMCLEIGLDFESVSCALSSFCGLKRRFEVLGTANGITIVDDYAHNPSKLRAAMHAAKTGNAKRVIAVFQPHRYSRTEFLLHELSEAFFEADKLAVMDIYSAGEKINPKISGKDLAILIKEKSPNVDVTYLPKHEEVINWLNQETENGDLVITLGAGDVCDISGYFYSELSVASLIDTAHVILPSPIE